MVNKKEKFIAGKEFIMNNRQDNIYRVKDLELNGEKLNILIIEFRYSFEKNWDRSHHECNVGHIDDEGFHVFSTFLSKLVGTWIPFSSLTFLDEK